MAIAALGALGSRLIPSAFKGIHALAEHIKEHHDEKAAAKAGLAPQLLNHITGSDLLTHPSKAIGTFGKMLASKAGITLTPSGLLAKYSQLRQVAPKMLEEFAKKLEEVAELEEKEKGSS